MSRRARRTPVLPGEWAPKQIDNPGFFVDDAPHAMVLHPCCFEILWPEPSTRPGQVRDTFETHMNDRRLQGAVGLGSGGLEAE